MPRIANATPEDIAAEATARLSPEALDRLGVEIGMILDCCVLPMVCKEVVFAAALELARAESQSQA
jgi:hypothetical protein